MDQQLYNHPELYEEIYAYNDYERQATFVANRVREHVSATELDALVVGCGPGNHTVHLIEEGFDVVAVDPSQAMLDAAAEKSDATFRRDSLPDLDVEGTFDLIFLPYTVINYLSRDELQPALAALRERLADDGVLIFDNGDFPDQESPRLSSAPSGACTRLMQFSHVSDDVVVGDAIVFTEDAWFLDRHLLTPFDHDEVAASLRDHGFEVETHDWYGTRSYMDDPAVFVATLAAESASD